VELEGGQRRVLHANRLRAYHARVNEALIANCAVVYDTDEDFGSIAFVDNKPEGTVELLPSQRIDLLKVSHLDEQQKIQYLALLDEFHDCFSDNPGLCKFGCHEINVSDEFKPKQLKPYKVPELLKP
jgi:hypothetical protein